MAKSCRRWISLLAILSVLLHAAVVARHHHAVFAAALADHISAHLTVVCGEIIPDNAAPGDFPAPNKSTHKCPICMGAVPAVAVADAVVPVIYAPPPGGLKVSFSSDREGCKAVTALPPSRAPPVVI